MSSFTPSIRPFVQTPYRQHVAPTRFLRYRGSNLTLELLQGCYLPLLFGVDAAGYKLSLLNDSAFAIDGCKMRRSLYRIDGINRYQF